MYLSRLSKEQRDLFIDMCIHAAMANDIFAEEEKMLIKQYCKEMHISEPWYEARESLNDVCKRLLEISKPSDLKIMIFNITELMLSDSDYNEDETNFMHRLVKKLNLGSDVYRNALIHIEKVMALYSEIDSFIFG